MYVSISPLAAGTGVGAACGDRRVRAGGRGAVTGDVVPRRNVHRWLGPVVPDAVRSLISSTNQRSEVVSLPVR